MADPLSQFSMLGSGFNSQLVQNPNAAGAPQQQQPPDSIQPIGGLTNPEHSRMWMQLQLQQQINQQQQRTTSSGDIIGSQMIGQQQLQRSPFSAGNGPSMQHISQFQNNGAINQMTAPQLQAALQQNRSTPAMLAGLQPNQARQLELMAQHRPSHNNSVNGLVASRLNPSQPSQQGFPQGMIGGTQNPGQQSQVNPATVAQMYNGTMAQDTKRVALQELRDRALHLHTNIKLIEQRQATLASQRSMMAEEVFLQNMAIAEQDIARKRAVLTKWNMMLSANGMHPIGQGIGQMNPPGPPPQPGVIPPQNTQGQQSWIPGTQQNSTLGFSGQSSPPPGVQQAMGGHMNIQQHNFSQAPQQNPGNPSTPSHSQPSNQNAILAPPSTLQSSAGTSVPPLDRARFLGSYRHFCTTKKLMINEAALNIGNERVDLHALHEEVLKLRATDRRMAPNFWHIIGSKLGFSFGEEQASSDVAIQVATIYKQFLHYFDTIYVASFLQESQKRNGMNPQQGQPQSQNSAMPPQPSPSNGPNPTMISQQQQQQQQRNPNGPQHPLQQVTQVPLMGFPGNSPHQFAQLIPYAYMTAAELRMRGVPEQVIALVEDKRQHLQNYIDHHQVKRKQSIGGAAGAINNPPGLGMGLSGLPGTQSQQIQLQPQMVHNATQQMNPNLRPGVPSGMQGPTSKSNEGNGTGLNNGSVNDGIQRPQIPQPHQVPTQNSLANAIHINALRGRPSQEQINNAAMFVQRTKKEYMTRSIAAMRFTIVPEEQRQEYSTVFDNLWRFVIEVDPKMTMYAVLLPEDLVRRLIAMVLTCQQQRSLLSSNPPRYLLELAALKRMTGQVQECILLFNRAFAAMNGGTLPQHHHPQHHLQTQPQPQPPQYLTHQPPQQPPQTTPQPPPQPSNSAAQQQIAPPSESSPRAQVIPPNLHPRVPSLGGGPSPGSTKPHTPPSAVNKTPSMQHATPSRVVNRPTPASSENTPAMPASSPPQSVLTPAMTTVADAASPTTTKSPKSKPRPKATKRKPSAKGSAQEAGSLPSPAPEQPMVICTPAPPTPVASVQTPGSDGSAKRRREDDEPPQTQNAPSPKRVKTEWETRVNEAALKRAEEVDSVKTDEEASKLLEEVVGLITQANTVDGQASMASDISDTLDQILKSYTAGSDLPSVGDLSDTSHIDRRSNHTSASSNDALAISDEFGDFFDFSSYDTFSKATTPDLVPASSTNTSPESASDGPAHTPLAVDTGFGDDSLSGGSDIRKLGFWTEIDGGEGGLYQQDNWKWDGQMPTMDPAWAISTTTTL